jgi:tetratricopeptide (TPR) repeat protein
MSNAAQLLRQGVADFKAGNREQAARLFYQAVQDDPQSQMGWLWLAGCLEDDNEKRQCLERARAINPNNELGKRAEQGLASMQSRLPEDENIPLPSFTADTSQPVTRQTGTTINEPSDRQLIEQFVARKTAEGWIVISQTDSSVQIQNPKKWSAVGFVLFVLLPILGVFLLDTWCLAMAIVGLIIVVFDYLMKKPKVAYMTAEQLRQQKNGGHS